MALMHDPDAVITFNNAPAPEAGDVIAAIYKFPDAHGVLLAQQDVLRRFVQEHCREYTTNAKPMYRLDPVLKASKWDRKSKVKVEQFAYNANRPNEGLNWDVYDPDDPDAEPQSTRFWFHSITHACRAGKDYAMPRADLPPRTGRANALLLTGIHWIRTYLEGFEDLFEIAAPTLNEMRRLGKPRSPQPRVEHSGQDLGTTGAVAVNDEPGAGTRTIRGVPAVVREPTASPSAWDAAARLREDMPDGYAWAKSVMAQGHLTIESTLPSELLVRLLRDTADLYYNRKTLDVPAGGNPYRARYRGRAGALGRRPRRHPSRRGIDSAGGQQGRRELRFRTLWPRGGRVPRNLGAR